MLDGYTVWRLVHWVVLIMINVKSMMFFRQQDRQTQPYNSKACGHTTRRHAGIQLEGMRDHLHKSNDPRQTDRVPPVSFLVIRTANPKQRILSDGGCETLAKNDNPAVLPAHELYAAGSTTRCCAHGHVSSTTGMPRSATLLKKYGKAACTILLLKGTFAVVPSLRSQSM